MTLREAIGVHALTAPGAGGAAVSDQGKDDAPLSEAVDPFAQSKEKLLAQSRRGKALFTKAVHRVTLQNKVASSIQRPAKPPKQMAMHADVADAGLQPAEPEAPSLSLKSVFRSTGKAKPTLASEEGSAKSAPTPPAGPPKRTAPKMSVMGRVAAQALKLRRTLNFLGTAEGGTTPTKPKSPRKLPPVKDPKTPPASQKEVRELVTAMNALDKSQTVKTSMEKSKVF